MKDIWTEKDSVKNLDSIKLFSRTCPPKTRPAVCFTCSLLHANYFALFHLKYCARNSSDILYNYPWLSPGYSQGSARHYTLPAIHNIQTNFLLPALSLVKKELGIRETSDIRELTILDPGSGDTVATFDLFSVSYPAIKLRFILCEASREIPSKLFLH